MPKRIGRPMVRRDPDERVPLATRIRGSLYNQLIDAALAHGDRSLGSEVEMRLEQSFEYERDLFDPRWRQMARQLIGFYLLDGEAGVIRLLSALPDRRTFEEPDLAEKRRRYQVMRDQLAKSVFAETDSVEAAAALMEDRRQQVLKRVEDRLRQAAEANSPAEDSDQ